MSVPCFGQDIQVEVCYHSAGAAKKATHLIAGVYDKESKTWLGTDFGAQSVRANSSGKVVDGNPRVRRESPEAGTVRWFKVDYKNGTLTSWLALAGGKRQWIRQRPTFETAPNYRKTGELAVVKNPERFYPGVRFYPDIVGTVGYVRITGYVDPAWIKEAAEKKGCDIDFDAIGLDDT